MADLAHPESESLRVELREAITSYRLQASLLTQITGFLAAADSLLIAYGFSQRISGILLVAGVMPLILIASYVEISASIVPLIYVAITLEQKLQLRDAPLTKLYVQTYIRGPFANLAKDIDMADQSVRESMLGLPRRTWLNSRIVYTTWAIFAAQISLFLISLLSYHYRFM
jgi:hypothetical protein